jgi:hypothetical protein
MTITKMGLARLGAALSASMNKQGIKDRDVQHITAQIFSDAGINKDSVCAIRGCRRTTIKPVTLQKLAPLIFRVKYFQIVGGNKIGVPIFDYDGPDYGFELKNSLTNATSVSDLPDLSFRYHTWQDLQRILEGEESRNPIPTKRLLVKSNTKDGTLVHI